MRVLIAPDKFAGTLSAVEAAEAIAAGWKQQSPDDELIQVPMSDGGPGFVDVLHAALGGELAALTVTGPLGQSTPATLLLVGDTAYVESSQACGLALVDEPHRQPERASTYGVGELLVAAKDAGAKRIVIGLGGSGTNDAGAGMLAALGALADPPDGLQNGGAALADLISIDVQPAKDRLEGVELLAASDVDNPLLGLRGATNIFGPQKGVDKDRIPPLDAALENLATKANRQLADEKGAGAAGGLGYGLMLVGATRVPGIETIIEAVRLKEQAKTADLVITGEGGFDYQSASGKVVSGVAAAAGEAIRPCVVLAGQVLVGSREMRTMGVQSAYSLVDAVGKEAALGQSAQSLATLAARVAKTWSR